MKGLGRVVIGSAVGGLLGAAAFIAVDGLMPATSDAHEEINGRSATVFLMNSELKEKVGKAFLYACDASQSAPGEDIQVTCWGDY